MKHMRSFMDDEVRKAIVLMEILWGDVACGVLAEADKVGASWLSSSAPEPAR